MAVARRDPRPRRPAAQRAAAPASRGGAGAACDPAVLAGAARAAPLGGAAGPWSGAARRALVGPAQHGLGPLQVVPQALDPPGAARLFEQPGQVRRGAAVG